jgi:hypothetical protein
MSMVLGRGPRNNRDTLDVPYAAWNDVLELAERYGWRPTRTGPPRWCRMKAADWCGTYYSSDGQLFYARDAAALVEALDRFLAGEPPVLGAPVANPDRERLSGFVGGVSQQAGVVPNVTGGLPAESWLGTDSGRRFLRGFVEFCRRGSFTLS